MGYTEEQIRGTRLGDGVQVTSYDVTVSTTMDADSVSDPVLVTMDSDDPPRVKLEARWRPQLSKAGALVRVYPRRGDKGILIFPDEGAPWLIW